MSALFVVVTGTDTGVGKTRVGTALARAATDLGARVRAVKPIESGCGATPSPLEDGVALARATGQAEPRAALCRLAASLAPPLAAEMQRGRLSFEALLHQTRALGEGVDLVLVEGAGGLLSPLTWEHTVIDLARGLGARALLVAADRLGTLSHVRVCLRVLMAEGVPLAGVVLSEIAARDPARDASAGTNLASLARLPDVPPVIPLPFVESLGAAAHALRPLAEALLGRGPGGGQDPPLDIYASDK